METLWAFRRNELHHSYVSEQNGEGGLKCSNHLSSRGEHVWVHVLTLPTLPETADGEILVDTLFSF